MFLALAPAVAQAPTPAPAAPPATPVVPGQEFVVNEVEIDRTAANAMTARAAALTEGQRLAFRRLLERMVPADQVARLPRDARVEIDVIAVLD